LKSGVAARLKKLTIYPTPMKQNFTYKGLARLYFIMRVTAINIMLLFTTCLELLKAGPVSGQSIKTTYVTIQVEHESLAAILGKIEGQTSFLFIYPPEILEKYTDVSLDKRNYSVEDVLNTVLDKLPLTYAISKNSISIRYKEKRPELEAKDSPDKINVMLIKGVVVESASGVAMPGVSIVIKGTLNGTTTDADGHFSIEAKTNDILVVSSVGYKNQEINVAARSIIDIRMEEDVESLREVVINGGYYTTTAETKVGNIVRVSGNDIKDQPLTSPLLGLQGRAAGVDVYPTSGVPGARTAIVIRGQSSLRADGGYPLYVIDGVPVDSSPVPASSTVVPGSYDPLSSLNPADIASIDILKDADATAIYGSRGANGVVLITTRKASEGTTTADFNVYRGIGHMANRIDMLNTPEYLAMRGEAFRNSGQAINEYSAPDLAVWDSTRYTDWQKELLGGTSNVLDAQAGISGGNANTSFRFSVGYYKETTIFPADFYFQRLTGSFSLNHLSSNKKFRVTLSVNYGVTENHLFDSYSPLGPALRLPPNAPALYSDDGTLNWARNSSGGSTWANPMAGFRQTNDVKSNNLMVNSIMSYNLGLGIMAKVNLGYTNLGSSEILKYPLSAYDPMYAAYFTPESQWTNVQRGSWIVEPQLVYNRRFGDSGVDAVIGATFQEGSNDVKNIRSSGYASDGLLRSLAGASTIQIWGDDNSQYRYTSAFARISYDFREKYLFSLTARRDGSSRFGANNRFGNFGAIGAGWIFSKERFISENMRFISFAKIRGSVGIMGNDQIGEYRYLKTYNSTFLKYQGAVGLVPSNLSNPDFKWEISNKIETGLELSFLNNRISMEVAWFRNRSSNLLVEYQLPGTAGFSTVLKNLDAVVENRGWEYTMSIQVLNRGSFQWTLNGNYSQPRNELVRFDDLEKSTYANTYVVGRPLGITKLYKSEGVDPETGLYKIVDVDGNDSFDEVDMTEIVNIGRTSFGGLGNTLSFKGLELSFLFQFVKQTARMFTPLGSPGGLGNFSKLWYDGRWLASGDVASMQKITTDFQAQLAFSRQTNSDRIVESASFVRLKSLQLSYSLPQDVLGRLSLRQLRFYIQGQNLFTISDYSGLDPETGSSSLPPLRVLSLGIQLGI
jgi:TonB-linked SusC/RagA family outer membrane protein